MIYLQPKFHEPDLNDLDVPSDTRLTRDTLNDYFTVIKEKICTYLSSIDDNCLLQKPAGCEYIRFTLIFAQHRHLHSHMGMIMGFLIDDTGLWPRIVGLENDIPEWGKYENK